MIASVVRLSVLAVDPPTKVKSGSKREIGAGDKKGSLKHRYLENTGLMLPVARSSVQKLPLSGRVSIVMQNHGNRSNPGDYRDRMDYRESTQVSYFLAFTFIFIKIARSMAGVRDSTSIECWYLNRTEKPLIPNLPDGIVSLRTPLISKEDQPYNKRTANLALWSFWPFLAMKNQ